MSADALKSIFNMCFNILNIKFNIIGFNVSLLGFLIFSIVAYLLIRVIFQLFDS